MHLDDALDEVILVPARDSPADSGTK